MLPVALSAGETGLAPIVPAEAAALRCIVVQIEVRPVKFPSATQENETNATMLELKMPPWSIILHI